MPHFGHNVLLEEKVAITDLLSRFFQSFDDHDWSMMRSCLCDEVHVDYSSFRNVSPSTLQGDHYVEQRRVALQTLDMQHNFLNLRIVLQEETKNTAEARCNFIIHRFHLTFDGVNDHFFHSYGNYFFELVKVSDTISGRSEWRIAKIHQNLLRNHGNREIHGATRTHENTQNDFANDPHTYERGLSRVRGVAKPSLLPSCSAGDCGD